MDNEIVKEFIDKDTGEIIEIYEGDSLKITRGSQKQSIENSYVNKECNEEIKKWNDELGGFVFVLFKYCNIIMKQHSEITSEDITKLFYLATFVNYEGYLIFDDSNINRKLMKEILGLSKNPFNVFFNKMKKLNIINVDKDKHILINKEYFLKGEIDKEIKAYSAYTRLYIKTVRYLYENVPKRKHKQLGNYFKLIPYIHRQENVLCNNPNDLKNKPILMTVKELQDLLDCHRHTVSAFMNELLETRLVDGSPILVFIKHNKADGESFIIVNPKVCYGGNGNVKDKEGNQQVLSSITKWFKSK
jgi:hypothetical protein